jgi:crotonobetainyl-CoA:carnitine CoA-transferase CaiB-like acyl-CoA transferase
MVLGDMGAEVIKVEGPGHQLGMIADREKHAAHDYLSRNKKSIVLNLKIPDAKKVFLQLACDADVVMEAFRPGVVERLGVDYKTVSEANPRIVYCSLTGYGQDGDMTRTTRRSAAPWALRETSGAIPCSLGPQ